MPIAPATAFITAAPGLPGAAAPVVSTGFGEAVEGVIGARRDVLPPAFAAPHPEDTAMLLATAQGAPPVAAVPADGVPAVASEGFVEGDGVLAPSLPAPLGPAPSVPAATALASGDPAVETLPVPTPSSEPERLAAKPPLPAPSQAAAKSAKAAAAPDAASAAPAAASAVVVQAGATAVAQVAAPVPTAAEAPADDRGANDNPPPEDGALAPALASPLALVAPLPTAVPAAPVAVVAPRAPARSDARAVAAPSVPPAAADPAAPLAAAAGEPVPADPQDGFADRLAAQVSPVVSRTGSDPAPASLAAPPSGAPVQQAAAPLAPAIATPAAPAAAAEAAPAHLPQVAAQPGRIGREMGVAIARRVVAGGHELTVRLNPAELGRIEVKMGFSDQGTLRATVAAESAVALDLLRRDSADLGRALADAGVRADAQSFRFDTRSGDGGGAWQRQPGHGGQGGQNGQPGQPSYPGGRGYAAELPDSEPVYRALRTRGRVDLMA